jgi:hypothetical protein
MDPEPHPTPRSHTDTVVPLSRAESIHTDPPACLTMPNTVVSPRPVPRPLGFVT